MTKKIIFIFFAIAISLSMQSKEEVFPKKIRILFIGNSLTYHNNLPKLVGRKLKSKGIDANIRMIAYPNYCIADHWKGGKVQKLINNGKYDYVIIQQGPSSRKNGREMLIDYGKKYSALCKKNNSRLCYFMVWPSINNMDTFENVIKNYSDAAAINSATLLPVGKKFKKHFEEKSLKFYSNDGFHPSLKGSKKAAEIIVNHLFKMD